MNAGTLVWTAFRRHKARTTFTFLSVVAAFMLFSILASVRHGMYGQMQFNIAQRLDTKNRVNSGQSLPLSYGQKIAAVPGVTAVAYLTGFNGYYKDRKNGFQLLFFFPQLSQGISRSNHAGRADAGLAA